MIRKAPPGLLAVLFQLLLGTLPHPAAGANPKGQNLPRPALAPVPGVVCLVDGIPITQLDWDHLANPYFDEIASRTGRKLNEDEQALLRKNVLDELIRERLWVADAKRRGIVATEAEIDAHLSKNPYFKTSGKFDEAKFRAFKSSPSTNYAEIKRQLENAVLLEKYLRWMETRYAPRETELKREFAERTAQASLRYFWLTPDAVSLEKQATADQMREYYDTHRDEFKTPDQARVTYIKIPIEMTGSSVDSVRLASEAATAVAVKALLASLKMGKSVDAVAKNWGGVKDTGLFKVGDPIKGLGRSDALTDAVRAGRPKQWLPEPIKVGPYYVVARLEERREPAVMLLREVVGLVKRRADAQAREAELDSLARAEYDAHAERYRTAHLRGSAIARATSSFDDPRPASERDVKRILDQLRKSSGRSDTALAWADSVLKTLPDIVRRERQVDLAFKTMGEVGSRLRRGEGEEEVARRYGATIDPISSYRGQPPAFPALVEGSLLDSLYKKPAGAVVGPRILRDSVFVVHVSGIDDQFLPPFEAIRQSARAAVDQERRRASEREAEGYFSTRRDRYLTPHRWVFDYVLFLKMKPDSAPVPEDSIKAYYESHPAEFTVPAKARARHILISLRPEDAAAGREAARKRVLDILKRAKGGEDFEALAKQFSEDRGSAPKGGDLGEITRGDVVKEFGDVAFALKPGQISELVETRFGFHIVRLDSLTPQSLRALDDCRSEIRTALGESLADSLARGEASEFATAAAKAGASFDHLAKSRGGMTLSPPVGAREAVPGLGVIPALETAMAPLSEGGISRPIALGSSYLVARLVRSIPPRPAEFSEVKEGLTRDMVAERKRALRDSIDTRLSAAIRAGADCESLLVPLGGLRASRYFGRRGPIPDVARDTLLARDSTLYDEVFASRPGATIRPRPGAVGTLYAVVDSLQTQSGARYAEARSELRREMVERRSAAWTERLRSRAKIQLFREDLKSEP